MAKAPDGKTPDKRLTDRLKREEDLRRVIGQGIIDGLLSPVGVSKMHMERPCSAGSSREVARSSGGSIRLRCMR